ncbi:TraR/DksA family transcriptional regulator [Microbispora triticiradicis]|uniref:TraR/DksA family transcriptional regulator n=1 Tax=Microbispora triticiradicis TaxID=2200763 RepID=UPI001AD69CE7|nr:TraR/DksA family transcriptional regulator [Microbispora triticiradicis]MBO4274116.1 conjugal transfer protein TraR [Microbispora triticiradicis]
MDVATARMRLESMLHELDRSIGVLRAGTDRHDGSSADAGAGLTDADRTRAMLDAAGRQRTAVLAALRRLDDGGYGRCVDCGSAVPDGRLEARPEAARCVQCQSRAERRR